jgi:hypothetical protein
MAEPDFGVKRQASPAFHAHTGTSAQRLARAQRVERENGTMVIERCPDPAPVERSVFMPVAGNGPAPAVPIHKRGGWY